MDALQRLMQIVYMDSSHKYGVTKTMDAQTIDQIYVMKSQMSANASILPINDNARGEEDPKIAVAKMFRANEREVIAGETYETPVLEITVPSSRTIKTHIFSTSINNVVQWTPIQRFSLSAEMKSKPQPHQEAIVVPMTPDYAGTNIVPLFPTRALTHTA